MSDNTQIGPAGSSELIKEVVKSITYKPGWTIECEHMVRQFEHLAGGEGLTLRIQFRAVDSTDPTREVGLDHYFAVPPAMYDRETWERWVFDCIAQMEIHEAMEMFKVDGWAPFFPPHGNMNGRSPYTIERRKRENP